MPSAVNLGPIAAWIVSHLGLYPESFITASRSLMSSSAVHLAGMVGLESMKGSQERQDVFGRFRCVEIGIRMWFEEEYWISKCGRVCVI